VLYSIRVLKTLSASRTSGGGDAIFD
jgi:hypothetical protein